MSRWWIAAALVALEYAIVLGGTGLGELHPVLRAINGVVAGAVIAGYFVLAPRRADRIDALCLAALLVFLAGAVFSAFPRQSLDSALGALTWAAAFFLARLLMADADARVWLVRVLIGLSAVLTIVAAARWLPPTVEWWMLTGVTPPLDMNRSGVLWGHRHDLALIVAVLYPAWWIGRRSPIRTAAAVVFGVLAAIVVIVDGSRTNWLALVVAGLAVAAPMVLRAWHPSRRALMGAAGGAALLVSLGTVVGLVPAALDRILTTNTLVSRADMWGKLLEAWTQRPIQGWGPGSFAWILQPTGYFDGNSWAPRHPDSLAFQVLPEVGLLGAVALGIVAVALAPTIWRAEWGPRFALVALAVAGIGSNPTEFAFMLLVGIAWAAYAAPNRSEPVVSSTPGWLQAAGLALLILIGAAFVSTVVAAFAHDAGRRAIAATNMLEATQHLETAERLDPGMALYPRLLGAARFLAGDAGGAEASLERAIALNPNDDLAWRTLALVKSESVDQAAAVESIQRAVELHRADPTNLLLRHSIEQQVGLDSTATAIEIVHAWPWIVTSAEWADISPVPVTDALTGATDLSRDGAPAPQQSNSLHAIWIAALADDDVLLAAAIDGTGLTRSLGEAYAAAVACKPVAAYLESAPAPDRRFDEYQVLRLREGRATGARDEAAERAWEIMTGLSLGATLDPLNPLDENGFVGLSTDTWGYRRPPTSWPDLVALLPSPDAAYRRWMLDPSGAAVASGLDAMADCR